MTQPTLIAATTACIALFQLCSSMLLLARWSYKGVKEFFLFLGLLFVYTLTASLLYWVSDQAMSGLLKRIQFASLCFIPFANLNFLQTYFRAKIGMKRFVNGFTLSLSLLFTLLYCIIPFHPGYPDAVLPYYDGLPAFAYELHHLHSMYQVTCVSLGMFAILRMVVLGSGAYRRQNIILIAAYVIPLLAGLSTLFSATRQAFDVLPFSFLISLSLMGFLFFRDSFFKVAPLNNQLEFEALQDGLLVLDENRVIVDYTAAARTCMPELSGDYIGVPLAEAAQHVSLLKEYWRERGRGEQQSMDMKGLCYLSDSKQWFEIREVAAKPQTSTFTLLLIRDITYLMEVVQALQTSNKVLQETTRFRNTVMQILSHDLRAPLVAMKSMKHLYQPNEGRQPLMLWDEASGELDDLIDRSDMLINHLLLLTDLQASYPITTLDTDTLLSSLPSFLLRYAQKKCVAISFEPEDCALIMGNGTLLAGTLRILVDNAIKFSDQGGTIVLRVAIQPRTVMITVEDEGSGFDDASLHAFEQDVWGVSQIGTSGEKGPGLGLYVAKRCMTHMQGYIRIEQKMDAGSKVSMIINRAFPTPTEDVYD